MSSSNSPADAPTGAPAVAPDVDRTLLSALARDGRASYTDLAERVGLSVSAVHQRVRRLGQRGLITRDAARLDAKTLRLPPTPLVSITPIHLAPPHDAPAPPPHPFPIQAPPPPPGAESYNL